jgi:hypothetical protein
MKSIATLFQYALASMLMGGAYAPGLAPPEARRAADGYRYRGPRKPKQGATRLFGVKYRRNIPRLTWDRDGALIFNPEYVQLRSHPLAKAWFDSADEYRRAKNERKRQRRALRVA